MTLHGLEADRHLFQCLFSSVDFAETSSKTTTPLYNQALLDQYSASLNKPSLISSICYVVDKPIHNQKVFFRSIFFNHFSTELQVFYISEFESRSAVLPTTV